MDRWLLYQMRYAAFQITKKCLLLIGDMLLPHLLHLTISNCKTKFTQAMLWLKEKKVQMNEDKTERNIK